MCHSDCKFSCFEKLTQQTYPRRLLIQVVSLQTILSLFLELHAKTFVCLHGGHLHKTALGLGV